MLRVSDDQIASMIDVDHKQTEDFLAFVDDGALVGSAMIAIEPAGERAEVAIAVRADYKHQGVGWTLLNRAADYAKTRGCRTLRSEEHTSELQSLMRISYAVFCLKKKKKETKRHAVDK